MANHPLGTEPLPSLLSVGYLGTNVRGVWIEIKKTYFRKCILTFRLQNVYSCVQGKAGEMTGGYKFTATCYCTVPFTLSNITSMG